MVAHIIAFAAGVWLLQRQAVLPPLDGAWLLLPLVALAMLLRGGGWPRRMGRSMVTLTCCAAAGFLWAAACAHWRLADHLPPEWESRDIVVTGVVAGLPQPYDRSVRFEFDVERVVTPGAQVPERVVLSWWGRGGRDGGPLQLPEIHAGERWELTVRLKRPHGLANPHGFDYEAWLLERGIRATGYVRPHSAERIDARVWQPGYAVEMLRESIRDRFHAALPDVTSAPYAGILIALAIGDQHAIDPGLWQTFARTGITHLMSISGLHVTM
ncbi:MAG: ComEC/Rec2 family competence protein, partial [Burkholderiales bacterium]|nr:ComEC/Rec2 family competence protein [Burkholderiales bacterium]